MSDHKSNPGESSTGVTSRRGFLQRISRVAGSVVAVLGGALAASTARAGNSGVLCCYYWDNGTGELFTKCSNENRGCPPYFHHYELAWIGQAPQCRQC